MTTSGLTRIEPGLLSPADRARVSEAASRLDALELPEVMTKGLDNLFKLVAAGRDATIISTDQQLTSNQAAALLGMSRPLLNKLLDQGRIPYHRNGRDRRIAASDVVEYITARDRLKLAHRTAAAGYERRRAERLAAIVAANQLTH